MEGLFNVVGSNCAGALRTGAWKAGGLESRLLTNWILEMERWQLARWGPPPANVVDQTTAHALLRDIRWRGALGLYLGTDTSSCKYCTYTVPLDVTETAGSTQYRHQRFHVFLICTMCDLYIHNRSPFIMLGCSEIFPINIKLFYKTRLHLKKASQNRVINHQAIGCSCSATSSCLCWMP